MNNNLTRTRAMVTAALLAALAGILMMFKFPLAFLPPFYKIDFSELPVLLGALMLGPVYGIVIELVKILINFITDGTTTAGVGEIANFIIGCSFVVPASIIYFRRKSKSGAIIGLVLGTLCCVIAGALLNAFVLLPAYAKAFHMDVDAIIATGTKVNSSITNMTTFVLLATTPLNLIKCVSVSIVTMFIYKPLSKLIKSGGVM